MLSYDAPNHDKYFYGFLVFFTVVAGLFAYAIQSV